MKIRILMLSLIGMIFFNSCSSDSNSTNSTSQNLDPNTILPKKIIEEELGSICYEFFYDQNKINYIQVDTFISGEFGGSGGVNCYFTYTGNLITKIQLGESGDEKGFIDFTYQNNKLINKKYTTFSGGTYISDLEYVYNSNNTISVLSNGILKTTYTLSTNQSYIVSKDGGDLLYSLTSSPFKNVIGIKEAFLDLGYDVNAENVNPEFDFLDILFSSTTRNIISITPFPGGQSFDSLHFRYAYNELLFPTNITRFFGSNIFGALIYEGTYSIFYQ
ncbi:MAG: hypothetical protein NTX74_09730 [Flavobacterium sp.]|nr:hypothetical protein [Flavobacterium sp.]